MKVDDLSGYGPYTNANNETTGGQTWPAIRKMKKATDIADYSWWVYFFAHFEMVFTVDLMIVPLDFDMTIFPRMPGDVAAECLRTKAHTNGKILLMRQTTQHIDGIPIYGQDIFDPCRPRIVVFDVADVYAAIRENVKPEYKKWNQAKRKG